MSIFASISKYSTFLNFVYFHRFNREILNISKSIRDIKLWFIPFEKSLNIVI